MGDCEGMFADGFHARKRKKKGRLSPSLTLSENRYAIFRCIAAKRLHEVRVNPRARLVESQTEQNAIDLVQNRELDEPLLLHFRFHLFDFDGGAAYSAPPCFSLRRNLLIQRLAIGEPRHDRDFVQSKILLCLFESAQNRVPRDLIAA